MFAFRAAQSKFLQWCPKLLFMLYGPFCIRDSTLTLEEVLSYSSMAMTVADECHEAPLVQNKAAC